jgi:hypothetical protein
MIWSEAAEQATPAFWFWWNVDRMNIVEMMD